MSVADIAAMLSRYDDEAWIALANRGLLRRARKDLEALNKAVAKAQTDLTKWGDTDTSFMGLTAPLIQLKNPGIISIPLGFLGVILGSLLFRDKRASDLWNEVYVRQNTGLMVSEVTHI